MSKITTHILDVSIGRPAAGVTVVLCRRDASDRFEEIGRAQTDSDGRVREFAGSSQVRRGVYRLRFETAAYFGARAVSAFYPLVDVCFDIADDNQHYHVPLLLSPFGYSTYRGS